MCGIAGFAAGSKTDAAIQQRLLERLRRRGPDGHWTERRGGYCLVQARLAVIDLSERVAYPMANETSDVWLLFNGEIYDHRAVRAQLEAHGHRFATDCDAEVVVHGYEQWGTGLFERLDGMFALALLDERRGPEHEELILTRDGLGIKPLVHNTGEQAPFAFASDAMALVAAGLSAGKPDRDAVEEFMAFHYVPPPATGVCDIVQLEPGTVLRRAPDGTQTVERWRPRPFSITPPPSSRDSADTDLAERLDASVRRQLVADVEVGVFLSAGLDSSLVLDSAVRAGARPTAFTIGFEGHGDYDETAGARVLAEALGVPHVTAGIPLDFQQAVDDVAGAYDTPFADASAIAAVALARLAREHVTVALSGTGGDDLFAGYYRHRVALVHRLASRLPITALDRLLGGAPDPGSERRSALTLARSYVHRLAATRGMDVLDTYLALAAGASSTTASGLVRRGGANNSPDQVARRLGLRDGDGAKPLTAIQEFECQTYLPYDLLVKEDRATMAVGLEGRVPLLGAEVLALAESLPDQAKISMRTGKRPLRALAQERLPRQIASGRKRGFAVPLHALFAGAWKEPARDWLATTQSDLIDLRAARQAFDSGRLTAPDTWALVMLCAWEGELAQARSGAPRACIDPR